MEMKMESLTTRSS